HLTIAGAGKDDRWLLAILRAASQASCGKLCAGFAYNHSVQQPLAKTAAGKITKPHCGFVRHFVAKFGFIRLTRWRFGLTNGNTLVYQHHGVEAEEGKDEKNAREKQCPVKKLNRTHKRTHSKTSPVNSK